MINGIVLKATGLQKQDITGAAGRYHSTALMDPPVPSMCKLLPINQKFLHRYLVCLHIIIIILHVDKQKITFSLPFIINKNLGCLYQREEKRYSVVGFLDAWAANLVTLFIKNL